MRALGGWIYKSMVTLFTPPFHGLGCAITLFVAWSFMVMPNSPIVRGNLPDPDDYMHLVQIIDWLQGQDWFDVRQYRLNPPEGVSIHFSRLVEWPIALLMIGVRAVFGFPWAGAATLVAWFYPLLLLGLFFSVVRWAVQPVVGTAWAGASAYIVLFASSTMFMFQPGHVDHHGVILILTCVALGSVVRHLHVADTFKWAVLAGGSFALALVVALEVLPWLLIVSCALGLWGVVRGGEIAKNTQFYGVSLWACSLIGLALSRPHDGFFVGDTLLYSITYVHLTSALAACFVAVGVLGTQSLLVRFCGAASVAVAMASLFLWAYPTMLHGPYGAIDPVLRQMILGEVSEAHSLVGRYFRLSDALTFGGTTLVAMFVCLGAFYREKNQATRWIWGLWIVLLVCGIGLAFFYQRRFMSVLGMIAVLPLLHLLHSGWRWIGAQYEGRPRFWLELGLLAAVGPLLALWLPAMIDNRPMGKGVVLFPAYGRGTLCDMASLEGVLRDPRGWGAQSHLILAPMGQGTELLFRTPHRVLSAPYHMNVMGNLDATRFFSTPYEDEARAILERRGVALVLACRMVPDMYIRTQNGDDTGGRYSTPKDIAPHMIERMMTGRVPSWLKPLPLPLGSDYVLYQFVR